MGPELYSPAPGKRTPSVFPLNYSYVLASARLWLFPRIPSNGDLCENLLEMRKKLIASD